MQETFREIWERLADHVCTSPHHRVTWYESDVHRLRLTADPETGKMWLYIRAGATSWRLIDSATWPQLEPRKLRHRAMAALIYERDKRFPERPVESAEAVIGCRPARLRTVARSAMAILALVVLCCVGCERRATPPVPIIWLSSETITAEWEERCATDGHRFCPSAIQVLSTEHAIAYWPWCATEMICTRCLKRVKV